MLDTNHNFYSKLQRTRNYLLVKDDVGKSKPNTRVLPSHDFSYGIKVQKDKEDARAVISSWAQNTKSMRQGLNQDFKKLNILSVGEKLFTAPQQRAFRKTINGRRMSSEEPKMIEDPWNRSFGMPLRPSTPMKAVLGHFYGYVASELKHLAYSDKKSHKNKKPLSMSYQVKKEEPKPKNLFKMKKFLKIGPRTSTRRTLSFSG